MIEFKVFFLLADRFRRHRVGTIEASRIGDGGKRGADPCLYQASVNREDTQLRLRGLEKGRWGSKVRRLSLIGFPDRYQGTFVAHWFTGWLHPGCAWMDDSLRGSGVARTQDDDFLKVLSDRIKSGGEGDILRVMHGNKAVCDHVTSRLQHLFSERFTDLDL